MNKSNELLQEVTRHILGENNCDSLEEEYEVTIRFTNFLLHFTNTMDDVIIERFGEHVYHELIEEAKKRTELTMDEEILSGR